MPRNDPNILYWESIVREQIRTAYNNFLQQNNVESSPHQAHLFAINYLRNNSNSANMNERDMIIYLVGELPEMYD
ncbi:hypothetical protein [Photobacterium damselae]|uniref:hypothetical protein n=1 Tax=Photobacterium damselae TaxID=38293 RepID=UPI001F40F582|nr:hypothetical protein [Photobacterium damselae]UKA00783.1 hypothetical protein IHC89_08700 [Photobacterium damselae subsp. damselae]